MTRHVNAQLVFEYQEPDRSVGIKGGFVLVGIQVGQDFLDVDWTIVDHVGTEKGLGYAFTPDAGKSIDTLAEELEDDARSLEYEPPDDDEGPCIACGAFNGHDAGCSVAEDR